MLGLATINPFRYRGYYYDAEIGMYYLQSRYYNPVVGRFINEDEIKIISIYPIAQNKNLYIYCANDAVNNIDPTGYLTWPGEIHAHVQLVLSSYILAFLNCFAYTDYFIRFNKFKYGFADLYAKKWNEIWEVKPNKKRYYKSGPIQLSKYINAIEGSKPGRNLGTFTTYYFSLGFYEINIISTTNDGMIYYDYNYCWRINSTVLLAITSIVLIATGAGAGAGAAGLSTAFAMIPA